MQTDKKTFTIVITTLIMMILLSFALRGNTYLTLWSEYRNRPIFGRDFLDLYYYGYFFRHRCFFIYDDQCLQKYCELYDPGVRKVFSPIYSPIAYSIHIPFTYLSPGMAKDVNFYLDHLLLFLTVLFVNLLFLRKRGWKNTALISLCLFLLLLTSSPVIDNLIAGQLNFVLIFIMSLFVYFYFGKNNMPASTLMLALAFSIKPFPLFIIFYFALRSQWKHIASTFLFIVLLNLPFVFFTDPVKLFSGLLLKYSVHTASSDAYAFQSLPLFIIRMLKLNLPFPALLVFYKVILAAVTAVLMFMAFLLDRKKSSVAPSKDLFIFTMLFHIFFLGFYFVATTHHLMILFFFTVLLNYILDYGMSDMKLAATIILFMGISLLDGEVATKTWEILFRAECLSANSGFILMALTFALNLKILHDITGKEQIQRDTSNGEMQPDAQ